MPCTAPPTTLSPPGPPPPSHIHRSGSTNSEPSSGPLLLLAHMPSLPSDARCCLSRLRQLKAEAPGPCHQNGGQMQSRRGQQRRQEGERAAECASRDADGPADLWRTVQGAVQGSRRTKKGRCSGGSRSQPGLAAGRKQGCCPPHAEQCEQSGGTATPQDAASAPADSAASKTAAILVAAALPSKSSKSPAPSPPRYAAWPPERGTCGSGTEWRHLLRLPLLVAG